MEAHSMVGHASSGGGAFFEKAHAGRGLAGVEHAATGSGDGIGELAGESRNAAQALQEVERYALALQQSAGVTFDSGNDFAGRTEIAIALQKHEGIENF